MKKIFFMMTIALLAASDEGTVYCQWEKGRHQMTVFLVLP
jgi:hypothetical protein